ncbi:MAG: hypothetical protein JSR99_02015 [Proteobacteria bacterium]|nr:hypothetical protein [Pseudomonadota bacterium]
MTLTASQSSADTPNESNVSQLEQLEARIDAMDALIERYPPERVATDLLELSEEVLKIWIVARGEVPTVEKKEGFALLALHRQGCRGEPSFNACRETCREIVYHYNLVLGEPAFKDISNCLRRMIMVARHLCLFVSGKIQVAGLGEFCCSSKPLRQNTPDVSHPFAPTSE